MGRASALRSLRWFTNSSRGEASLFHVMLAQRAWQLWKGSRRSGWGQARLCGYSHSSVVAAFASAMAISSSGSSLRTPHLQRSPCSLADTEWPSTQVVECALLRAVLPSTCPQNTSSAVQQSGRIVLLALGFSQTPSGRWAIIIDGHMLHTSCGAALVCATHLMSSCSMSL